jgi:hypothetical protein
VHDRRSMGVESNEDDEVREDWIASESPASNVREPADNRPSRSRCVALEHGVGLEVERARVWLQPAARAFAGADTSSGVDAGANQRSGEANTPQA